MANSICMQQAVLAHAPALPYQLTQVVTVMKGQLHASVRALDGYAALLHTLLALMRWYPKLREIVDDRIHRFLDGERGRNKYQCRSLGEWLPLLAMTDKYSWEDVCADYLEETFDRNAKWCVGMSAGSTRPPPSIPGRPAPPPRHYSHVAATVAVARGTPAAVDHRRVDCRSQDSEGVPTAAAGHRCMGARARGVTEGGPAAAGTSL